MIQDRMQKGLRGLFKRVAKRVKKNHLFEQPGERSSQPPVFTEVQDESIRLMNAGDIEERLLGARVVNHWATWCEPCVEELDILSSIQSHIGSEKMLGINWDLFQGGSFAEAKVDIVEQTDTHGLDYSQCVVSDEPDVFFQQFDLEQQIVPQTFVYSPMFEVLFHRVGVLTEEDIATIVELVKQSE